MAGHRRTRGPRAADGSVRPTARAGRADRIRSKAHSRYATAETEADRFAVAVDYVRAAAATVRKKDPVRTDVTLSGLVRQLLRAGDALLDIKGGNR